MKVLLDTHAFLWFALADARLSASATALLCDPRNELLLSPATYWEIAIKVSLGKYRLAQPLDEFLDGQIRVNRLSILPIAVRHVAAVAELPFHHRDPFDRLLVAQALTEGVPLVSSDESLDAYGVDRRW